MFLSSSQLLNVTDGTQQKRLLGTPMLLQRQPKHFSNIEIWIKAHKQNGHFHAVLINNVAGSTQNTPMKEIAAFSIFPSFCPPNLTRTYRKE